MQATTIRNRRQAVSQKMEQINRRVNGEAVLMTTVGSVCTLSFGFYTVIFVMAGGGFWLWAILYGILTLMALGYTIWYGCQIGQS